MVSNRQRGLFEEIYLKYSSNPPWSQKAACIDVFAIADKVGIPLVRARVLDLGCGNGKLSTILENNNFKVFGIDFSLNALKFAKKKYKLSKITAGDALSLPFKDKSFDLVIDLGLLHCINPVKRFLLKQELVRVLKKNGKYIMSEFFRGNKTSYLKPLFYAFADKIGKTPKRIVGHRQIPTWGLNLTDIELLFRPEFSVMKYFQHGDHFTALMQKRSSA